MAAETLECSICCDEIGCARATLACNHTFHLGCIGRWILKNESCPMCRRAMEEKERIAEDAEGDEESEEEWDDDGDDEDDEEDDDGEENDNRSLFWRRIGPGHWVVVKNPLQIPEFDEEAHALWVMRKTFEMAEDSGSVEAGGVQPQLGAMDDIASLKERYDGLGGFLSQCVRYREDKALLELSRERRKSF